ncbi:hypothetical protein E4U57_001046 [Claviceps arundinis]|uniref:Uncharacterized protein n=1 Tax=Claviceps arundinis TaxID=1623583 RepID=A0ABQ7PBM9_9HYPO|nr:hypothetical protein E4U57_001046 [Claviceps arundinis]
MDRMVKTCLPRLPKQFHHHFSKWCSKFMSTLQIATKSMLRVKRRESASSGASSGLLAATAGVPKNFARKRHWRNEDYFNQIVVPSPNSHGEADERLLSDVGW